MCVLTLSRPQIEAYATDVQGRGGRRQGATDYAGATVAPLGGWQFGADAGVAYLMD